MQREQLCDVVWQFTRFDINILLFCYDQANLEQNREIFKAVQKYIKECHRFVD